MNLVRQHFLPACLALLFSGCALSPQLVNIHPELKASPDGSGAPRAELALEVTDARESKILGRRGGVYSDTATLTTSGDITGPLRESLASALSVRGYTIGSSRSLPVLRVAVREISYRVQKNRVTQTIETQASVSAEFSAGNRTYNNTYTSTRGREMLTAPTASENERLINDTLAATLQQLLGDEELFGYIDSRR